VSRKSGLTNASQYCRLWKLFSRLVPRVARTEAALLRAMVLGGSQFPTFAAKYAKGSAILRTSYAEHKLGFPVASDAANYICFKRSLLKGHGRVVSRCEDFRLPSCRSAWSQLRS